MGPPPSLYVHVPFCRGRCSYCSFVSYTAGDRERERAVVRRTVEEARWWADHLGGLEPRTVYVGGGTPSAIESPALDTLLGGLRALWSARPAEFTVEANPESLDERFLEVCAKNGVDRLSLGVQTFQAGVRRAAGRRCADADLEACRGLVHSAWKGELSMDLIAGFSAQSQGDVIRDVDAALTWEPDHVSLYTLTLDDPRRAPGLSAQADELWLEGFDRLEARGYPNYEICNFARPGSECRHNLVYWRLEPYVGVGPSAVSTVPDGAGGALRTQSPRDLETFLREPAASPLEGAERVEAADLLFESLLMGLRLRDGVDLDVIERRLEGKLESVLPRTLKTWAARSFLVDVPRRLVLSQEARLVLDSLLVEARMELDTVATGGLTYRWP